MSTETTQEGAGFVCLYFGSGEDCWNCGGWLKAAGGPFDGDSRYCSEDCFADAQERAAQYAQRVACCPECGYDNQEHAPKCSSTNPLCPGGCGCRLGTADADRSECGRGPLEPCGPHLARGPEGAVAESMPDDAGQAPPAAPERARERAGAPAPDPREPLGRLVHTERLAVSAEKERPFHLLPWEERSGEQRELDMRIGHAVANYALTENAITWNTDCTSCARVLDSAVAERERAERAEAKLSEVRRTIAAFFTHHGNSSVFALQSARDLAEGIRQVLDRAPLEPLEAGTGEES